MPEGIGRGGWEGTIEGTEEGAGEGVELERASPLPEYTTSGSYSSDRHGELVRWALRADRLLPVRYGNGSTCNESGSVLKSFRRARWEGMIHRATVKCEDGLNAEPPAALDL